jgi:hypothetical protein
MVYQIYIILKKYLIVYISMLKNSELNYYIYIYIERFIEKLENILFNELRLLMK